MDDIFGKKESGYGRYGRYGTNAQVAATDPLNFAASEAYKLLRTNIEFSFSDEEACRVIGVTSAQSGEGKSTTSLNLANSLADSGHRVLLLECDMRLPTLADRLNIPASPGLSNLLVNKSRVGDVLRASGLSANLYAVTGGDIPPNPSELLGSPRMSFLIEVMSERFEYIILDLPPVNVVSDALVVSKLMSGMILIVRQDYSTRKAVSEAMRMIEFAGVPFLGFVLTRSGGKGGRYYKKDYYKSYGYGYSSSYAKASASAKGTGGRNGGDTRAGSTAGSTGMSGSADRGSQAKGS